MPKTNITPTSLTLAERYRSIMSLEAGILAAVPIMETGRGLILTEQAGVFGETVEGKKARIVVITAGLSLNGNIYTPELLKASVAMFEGAKVFYNHRGYERDFRELAGELLDVRFESDRITATFEALASDTWLQSVLATKPHLVEFSIFVWALSEKNDDDTETLTEILKVQSVDIVDEAAAGGKVLQVLEHVTNGAISAPSKKNERKTSPEAGLDLDKDTTTKERKETSVDDKVRIAQLEAEKAKSDADMVKLQLKVDTMKDTQDKTLKAIEARLKASEEKCTKLEESNAGLANTKVIENYLAAARADEKKPLKPAIEKAIRGSAAKHAGVVTEKDLDALRLNWETMAAEFAADEKPADENLDQGIPSKPADEAPKEKVAEGVELATDLIYGFMNVEKEKPAK